MTSHILCITTNSLTFVNQQWQRAPPTEKEKRMSGTQPEVLNERQVQEVYGFTIPYLRRARRERRGPRFLKIGKLVRYRRTDIEAYLSAHAVETRDQKQGVPNLLSER